MKAVEVCFQDSRPDVLSLVPSTVSLALDEYRAILRRTGEGLRQKGTQHWIGGQFKNLLETHRNAFAGTTVLAEEKHKSLQELTAHGK